MSKIMVIAAHPDDETLGAGATIAKHVRNGDEVHVLILGEGVTSRYEKREQAAKSELDSLREECKKALDMLGVKNVCFFDFPDNKFDSVPLLEIIKKIEAKIVEIKPAVVYTHYYGDLNIDHQITFEAVMVACRPLNESVKKILCFEVPSSTGWNAPGKDFFSPNCYIDVKDTLDKKLAALKEYKGEMREFPHPRSEEFIGMLAKIRGGDSGYLAAEAFVIVRERVDG